MKKLLLILLVLPTISFAENKTCSIYIREYMSDKDMFTAARQIRNSCDSGMILDYRVMNLQMNTHLYDLIQLQTEKPNFAILIKE